MMTAIFKALSQGGGQSMGMPDVCLVPAPPAPDIPMPFPSIGNAAQAKKTAAKVLFAGKPAVTEKSEIPKTKGDEAGIGKGVVSRTQMDKVTFKKGSAKVIAQGSGCIHLAAVTAHNGSNANMPVGIVQSCSQDKVFINP